MIARAALVTAALVASAAAMKTCPADEPTPFTSCDDTVYRSGLSEDDRPCEYSSCPGGDSAVCGCVDLAAFGGSGVVWQCQKGSCECPTAYEPANDVGCNVTGSDFQNASFTAPWRLDGDACGADSTCQCHPVYGDGDLQAQWEWHCSPAAAAAAASSLPLAALVAAGATAWARHF